MLRGLVCHTMPTNTGQHSDQSRPTGGGGSGGILRIQLQWWTMQRDQQRQCQVGE